MPQSHAFILIHVIFSTKERAPFITPAISSHLHAYLATVSRNAGCECYRAGGIEDHVHLAIRLSRSMSISNYVEEIKTSSSKWMKTRAPDLSRFSWQNGYGAFSVSPLEREALCGYIDGQEAHHRKRTFQEEYRAFLKKYGIEYDERYVWD
jgi:putative transposase